MVLAFASIAVDLYINDSDHLIKTAQHKASSHSFELDSSSEHFKVEVSKSSLANSVPKLPKLLANGSYFKLAYSQKASIDTSKHLSQNIENVFLLHQSRAPPLT